MFPPRFEYKAPATLDEALDALAEGGEEAKVLSGGQSLIPLLKLRFASPALIVDINRLPGLDRIEESDGHLRIGALVRHNDLAASDLLGGRYPAMAAAAPLVADPIVRNRGTMAGSLAHADPAGDWGSVMLALGGEVVATSSSGERVLPAAEFLVDTFTTALRPDEILTEVRVPQPQRSWGGAYLKLERKVGDFATVGAAVQIEMSNGTIGSAGIGLTAVGAKNLKAERSEGALRGAEPGREAFEEAGRLAALDCVPVSDDRGPADYKRAVVRAFVVRGLTRAAKLAGARTREGR